MGQIEVSVTIITYMHEKYIRKALDSVFMQKTNFEFEVIVGEDASDNTKKMFTNMCEFYEVPMFIFGTKDELGHAMGKEMRASLAITDSGFAKSLTKLLNE